MLPEADQKKLKESFDRGYLALRYASPAIFALVIGRDPLSGHLFLFAKRSRTRLKLLF